MGEARGSDRFAHPTCRQAVNLNRGMPASTPMFRMWDVPFINPYSRAVSHFGS